MARVGKSIAAKFVLGHHIAVAMVGPVMPNVELKRCSAPTLIFSQPTGSLRMELRNRGGLSIDSLLLPTALRIRCSSHSLQGSNICRANDNQFPAVSARLVQEVDFIHSLRDCVQI